MIKVKDSILEKSVSDLLLNKVMTDVLISNNILTVADLWCLNRKTLKNYGLKDSDINQIIIKLQLLGLDLNKRINK